MDTSTFATSASLIRARTSPLLLRTTLIVWALFCMPADYCLYYSLCRPHTLAGMAGLLLILVSLHAMWLVAGHIAVGGVLSLRRAGPAPVNSKLEPHRSAESVAVLLCTRDDWLPGVAESCLGAMQPGDRLFVCDDSESPAFQEQTAEFGRQHPHCVDIVRRGAPVGFKAGNLNHCLRKLDDRFQYVLVVDHDNRIESDTIDLAVRRLAECPSAPFVQFAQRADGHGCTSFAEQMMVSVRAAWRLLSLRRTYGLPLCVGHTVMFRREALTALGGFPESVTEDIALTLALLRRGLTGCYELASPGTESIPDTYQAFRARYVRWCLGTVQCWGWEIGELAVKRWRWHELYDGLLQLAVLLYPVPLLILWIGMAMLSADTGSAGVSPHGPVVMLALVGMLIPSLPLLLSSTGILRALRNVAIHVAVYMSLVVPVNATLAAWLITRRIECTNTGNRLHSHALSTSWSGGRFWSANGLGTSLCEFGVVLWLALCAADLGFLGASLAAGVLCGVVWQLLPWCSWISATLRVLPLTFMLLAAVGVLW